MQERGDHHFVDGQWQVVDLLDLRRWWSEWRRCGCGLRLCTIWWRVMCLCDDSVGRTNGVSISVTITLFSLIERVLITPAVIIDIILIRCRRLSLEYQNWVGTAVARILGLYIAWSQSNKWISIRPILSSQVIPWSEVGSILEQRMPVR